MTKEQKADIETWIKHQVNRLNNELDTWYLEKEEEAVIKAKRDVYSEIQLLLNGTLVVNDDYTELRPA